MSRRFVSRPKVIEAVQWTGENWSEVMPFGADQGASSIARLASTVHQNPQTGDVTADAPLQLLSGKHGATGWLDVPVGHWIARSLDGTDWWPIDPEVFAATYEEAS